MVQITWMEILFVCGIRITQQWKLHQKQPRLNTSEKWFSVEHEALIASRQISEDAENAILSPSDSFVATDFDLADFRNASSESTSKPNLVSCSRHNGRQRPSSMFSRFPRSASTIRWPICPRRKSSDTSPGKCNSGGSFLAILLM